MLHTRASPVVHDCIPEIPQLHRDKGQLAQKGGIVGVAVADALPPSVQGINVDIVSLVIPAEVGFQRVSACSISQHTIAYIRRLDVEAVAGLLEEFRQTFQSPL